MTAKLGALCFALAAIAPAQVKLPAFNRVALPNGATLLLLPRSDVPMITVNVLFRGGLEADPADRAGLGSITAELLRRGTSSRTADQFSEQVDFIGASFSAGVSEQTSSVRIEFPSKDTDRALDLLADVLLRPAFPEAEVKKVLTQRIDASKAAKDNPGSANATYFRSFFFGPAHPYGRSPNGDELTLAGIAREQIVQHHRRFYCGRNAIVVAAGDFETAAFDAKLRKALAAMPEGQSYDWVKSANIPERKQARLLLIDKPDATQTYFLIARPGIHRTHPDRTALWIVNTLFGGRFTSMLNDELRVNSGLTYGASSRYDQDRLPGAVAISTYTRTDTTVEAIDLALDVLKRLVEKGITADQLASTKTYIKGNYPRDRLETADQLAAALADIELFALNRGEVDDLFSRIDSVTLEQANEVARRYWSAQNLQFCVLGNAAKIRDKVAKYAPVRKEIAVTSPGFTVPVF